MYIYAAGHIHVSLKPGKKQLFKKKNYFSSSLSGKLIFHFLICQMKRSATKREICQMKRSAIKREICSKLAAAQEPQ